MGRYIYTAKSYVADPVVSLGTTRIKDNDLIK